MARIARVVGPGLPHHIKQRGNRRQQTFFCADDYCVYLDLRAQFPLLQFLIAGQVSSGYT
jgi:putative transposase